MVSWIIETSKLGDDGKIGLAERSTKVSIRGSLASYGQ